MCSRCEWYDEAKRADEIAATLPSWMTRRSDLAADLAESIRQSEHVTKRQTELLDEMEAHVE